MSSSSSPLWVALLLAGCGGSLAPTNTRPAGTTTPDGGCLEPRTFYEDGDGGGVGVEASSTEACEAPEGFARESGDCDDENCDGQLDEAFGRTPFYADLDGDGFGDPATFVLACVPPRPVDARDLLRRQRRRRLRPAPGHRGHLQRARGLRSHGRRRATTSTRTSRPAPPRCAPASTRTATGSSTTPTPRSIDLLLACVQPAARVDSPDDCDDSTAAVGGPVDWLADAEIVAAP